MLKFFIAGKIQSNFLKIIYFNFFMYLITYFMLFASINFSINNIYHTLHLFILCIKLISFHILIYFI